MASSGSGQRPTHTAPWHEFPGRPAGTATCYPSLFALLNPGSARGSVRATWACPATRGSVLCGS